MEIIQKEIHKVDEIYVLCIWLWINPAIHHEKWLEFNLFIIQIKKRFIKNNNKKRKLVDEAGKCARKGEVVQFFFIYLFIYLCDSCELSFFMHIYIENYIHKFAYNNYLPNITQQHKKKLHNPDDIRHFFFIIIFFGMWHKFFNHFIGDYSWIVSSPLIKIYLKPQCFTITIKSRLKFFKILMSRFDWKIVFSFWKIWIFLLRYWNWIYVFMY